MRARRAALLLCCLPGLAGAAAAGASPRDAGAGSAGRLDPRPAVAALDACLKRLDAELDVGIERIGARCPGLVAALEAGGVAALLPADWRRPGGDLSAGGLRALRGLLASSPAPASARPPPDTAALAALVAAARGEIAAAGPWERFTRWLRGRLEGGTAGPPGGSAWARWLEGRPLSARVWTVLGHVAWLALVVLLAWVVRAEWRAAGGLGGRRRMAAAGATAGSAPPDVDPARIDDVAPTERPAWLLRRLARRLQSLGRLPAVRALTAREVAALARLDGAADRESLRDVALAAERVRYGAAAPRPGEIDTAVGAGLALLARLEAAPPAAERAR